jgi:non-specific serine/threonine protein kinase
LAVASPTPSVAPQPAQRQEASLPAPVEETAAASAGGKLFVLGGFNAAGASLDSVFVFDGSAWQAGPRLPLPVDHPSASSLGGQVYLAGGHSNGRDSARLFRLDGSRWTELAPMHFARGGHALLAEGGKLYAIGGNTYSGNVAAVEAYDPGANSWTVVSQLSMPRNHVSGFVLGSKVCVAAGRSPATTRVDCLDTFDGSWSRLPDLPRATSGGGATTLANGDVVMMGGENAGETLIVDMLTHYSDGGGWTAPVSMFTPRHGFELAVFQDRAWACGGATAPGLHPVAVCTSVANVR